MDSFVAYAVDNSVSWPNSATNCRGFVNPVAGGENDAPDPSAFAFTFVNIEAAAIRAGSKTTPATTRGGAL